MLIWRRKVLNKEDIILLHLGNVNKLIDEIWKGNVPKSNEIRTLICDLGNFWCIYYYAKYIDKKPTSMTRTAISREHGLYKEWENSLKKM